MKTMRNLFLLCAGLSLFACSSDDDATQQFPEGKGAVTVKLVNPLARTTTTPTVGTNDETVEVTGDITVTLTHNGGQTMTETIIDGNTNEVTFWGVTNPTKITASVNDGVATTSLGNIETYQTESAASIPAYGETGTFNPTQRTEEHDAKTYQMYEATVTMSIPFARIEFSVQRSDAASTEFTTLNLGGVYLDNLQQTLNGEVNDYKHSSDVNIVDNQIITFETTATGSNAILSDTPASTLSFVEANAIAPADGKVYAYNIYPCSNQNMPKIKVWFNNATKTDATILPYQYAVVASYGSLTQFEAGKIYKITADKLTDNNIKPLESGTDTEYAIDVTVTEATWTIVEASATWQ